MMRRIQNSAAVKFISKNSKVIVCVVAALVLAMAVIGYFRNYRRENFDTNTTKPNVYMFSVDWCPHCKAAKPEFKACENSSVNFKLINAEDEANKELVSGFNIEGYPTFALVKDGNTEYYDGERSKEGIEGWLTEKGL